MRIAIDRRDKGLFSGGNIPTGGTYGDDVPRDGVARCGPRAYLRAEPVIRAARLAN